MTPAKPRTLPPSLLRPLPLLLLVAALVGSPVPGLPGAQAQQAPSGEPDAAPSETFTDIIDVRVVEVEAVVTGKDGQRIEGLTPASFRLLVDGEEVPVEYFSEVRHGGLVGAGEEMPEEMELEVRPAELETPGRSFLVFLDDYFTDRRYRHRLLKHLIDNVATLGPNDRMAVVRFEGYGLEMLSPWTKSKEDLTAALVEARKKTPGDLIRATKAGVSANPEVRSRILGRQIGEVASAMAVAMRSLADVPGRKLLLPVSEGWPYDSTLELPGAGGVTAETTRNIQATDDTASAVPSGELEIAGGLTPQFGGGPVGDTTARELASLSTTLENQNLALLRPMIDTANLLGFTIYPMHVGETGLGGAGELERSSLWILARETGGRIATEGAAATLPLQPVVDDTGSYYVLGFSPERQWDDDRHRLEIQLVDLPGAEVRHRKDFRDLSRRARRAMEAEEALMLGEGGDLQAVVGEPRKARGGLQVPVRVQIPMDWVTMVPKGKQWAGQLELRVATLDKRGGRSDIPAIEIPIRGPEPPPGSHFTYEGSLKVRSIEQRLVLYLYDTLSGDSKVAAFQLDP